MVFLVSCAALEAQLEFQFYGALVYTGALAMIFTLAIWSLVMTFTTHPGEITDELISRLKSQLMTQKQMDDLFDIHGEKVRLEYIVKCLNNAILKHI